MLFHEAERKVQQLEEKYRRSINKAKPYFDLKAECDQKLSIQKEVVNCLKKAVKDAKCSYAASLRALEEISNQIHEKRRDYGRLQLFYFILHSSMITTAITTITIDENLFFKHFKIISF